jgi:phosphoglycerol transferase MdoB-like AlkP superfamily enzyme
MDDELAVKKVQEYLRVNPEESRFYDSPIARLIKTEGEPVKANVIVVIMESMSAEKMSRYGNPHNLTPNLENLAKQSLIFDNIYTSGIHTSNGIFSTLFSFAAIFKQHPLKPVSMLAYAGLPMVLRQEGYRTIFFITHDEQFDNMGGFLRANGFEEIVSQKDYSPDRILSSLGVPDHYLFESSIPRINELYKSNQPFLAVYLTVSDHVPYIIPGDIPFKPKRKDKRERIVEYADWSIGRFIDLASQQEWFENTLFVFIADHGANLNPLYEMPLSYFHTPLIFYSPSLIPGHRTVAKIGGQIDVFPTIMGLLNISYVNNTLGIDLLKENRPYIYFCSDDKLGCLCDDYFLSIRDGGGESLYDYKNQDPKNRLKSKKEKVERMKDYLYSMMQATQWLIKNGKVGLQSPRSPGQPR